MLRTLFLIVPFLLLVRVNSALALPECPGSYNQKTWHECEGTMSNNAGLTYTGEWRNGYQNGHGTLTFDNNTTLLEPIYF